MLAHWVCGVDPQLCLVTDRRRPWFPATFGMLGGGLSTTRCSQRAREIAADKHLSGSLLRASGFRLPESASFSSDARKSALRYAKSIGGAAVVKPLRSGQSRGVTMGIRSTSDFHAAMQGLELAGFGEEDFLVEEEIVGRNYRFVASQDRLLSVLERSPLSVIGDGRSSIRRLVAGIDARRPGLPPETELEQWLECKGLAGGEIPAPGERVILDPVCNANRGSHCAQVIEEVHPAWHDFAKRVVESIPGADFLGIDLQLTAGHEVAPDAQGSYVLEVNVGASLGTSLAPDCGPAVNLPRAVLEDLAEDCALPLQPRGESCHVVVDATLLSSDAMAVAAEIASQRAVTVEMIASAQRHRFSMSGLSEEVCAAIGDLARVAGALTGIGLLPGEAPGDVWLGGILGSPPLLPRKWVEELVG